MQLKDDGKQGKGLPRRMGKHGQEKKTPKYRCPSHEALLYKLTHELFSSLIKIL